MINNTETCDWHEREGYWITDCGHEFVINDGIPSENYMRYCCYCGKKIKQFEEEEQKC